MVRLHCRSMLFQKWVRTVPLRSVLVMFTRRYVNQAEALRRFRKRKEDGLFYMEVEQTTAITKQTNISDTNEITEGVCYAEIKRT